MSESSKQTLEFIAAILAILAFAGALAKPLLIAIIDLTTPYLDRFNNKGFIKILRSKLGDIEHVDLLYCDPRRLTAWCSRAIYCAIVDIVLFVIAYCGALWFIREKIGGDRYTASLAWTFLAILGAYYLLKLLVFRQRIVALSQPATFTKNQLASVDRGIRVRRWLRVPLDDAVTKLRNDIANAGLYGEWNCLEPDFDRAKRVGALSGIFSHVREEIPSQRGPNRL